MINGKTVFIVGAGASEEAGLPIGSKLAQSIAGLLDIKFRHGYEQFSGSYQISAALRAFVNSAGSDDINPYLHAGRAIRDAAPLALSIDNFIDAHRGDKGIELCGKLAISQAILRAEQGSKLHFDQNKGQRLDTPHLADTW
ncbi:MAG TPA: hypothetical protein VFS01_14250, partial [Rhizomicrobium sp.]|nr:hypothetical protein [Rhizomicrobium sp.]